MELVGDGWSWLVMDGVQTDFGFSFDAVPTIGMVLLQEIHVCLASLHPSSPTLDTPHSFNSTDPFYIPRSFDLSIDHTSHSHNIPVIITHT